MSMKYLSVSVCHNLFSIGGNGENVIIDFNIFRYSNNLGLSTCFTGHIYYDNLVYVI